MRHIIPTLLTTTLSLFLFSIPSSAQNITPWIPVEARKLCNTTETAFRQFRETEYEPAITSRVNGSMLTVWVNTKREVMVTTTISVPNTSDSLTCIVAVGAEKTYLNPEVFSEKSDSH